MSRRVFLSFHYRDLWRAQIVRNSGAAESVSIAGFASVDAWEDALRRGDVALRDQIDRALEGTSVTVVLIGAETASRKYVDYEITRSIARANGLLGIRIHTLKDREGNTDVAGPVPTALMAAGVPIYSWEYGKLGGWIEDAYKAALAKHSK